ncbi:HNH endonuclease [Reyranella sp.]|uniref:HNH endonuclease n=1 Tax=Reyranella sp. TaxID=1929291 RepID=UPI00403714AE
METDEMGRSLLEPVAGDVRVFLMEMLGRTFKVFKSKSSTRHAPKGHRYVWLGKYQVAGKPDANIVLWEDSVFHPSNKNKLKVAIETETAAKLAAVLPWLHSSDYKVLERPTDIAHDGTSLTPQGLSRFDSASPYVDGSEIDESDFIEFGIYLSGNRLKIAHRAASFISSALSASSRRDFEEKWDVATLKGTGKGATTVERLVEARLGHGEYRNALLRKWGNQCAVSDCGFVGVLRASHVKPWSASNDIERLDPENGLLLVPTLDALFDRGFITFAADGAMMVSTKLAREKASWFDRNASIRTVSPKLAEYLTHHREKVFIDGDKDAERHRLRGAGT